MVKPGVFKVRGWIVFVVLGAMLAMRASAAQTPAPVDPAKYDHPVRVACVGDSITFGAGLHHRETNSFPAQLGRILGQHWNVKNFGHSGATLLNKGNVPYQKTAQYRQAIQFKADVVVIMLGTNDSKARNWKHKADFVGDYKQLVEKFRSASSASRIYLCLPIPAVSHRYGIRRPIIHDEILPMVRTVAQQEKLPVIDLYQAMKPYPKQYLDGIHPNPEGYHVIATTIASVLTGQSAKAGASKGAEH